MRYIVVVLTLAILLGGATSAQAVSPIKIYAGVGFSDPSDPVGFSDNYDRTYHTLLGLGLTVFPMIEAIGKVEYHSFGEDIEDLEGGKFKATLFGVDGKFTLSLPTMPFSPYAIAGVGLAAVDQDEFSSAVTALADDLSLESQTRFYYDFGFGVQWDVVMGVSVFGQLHWVRIDTKDDRVDLEFEGFTANQPYDDGTKFWAATIGVKLL